MGTLKLCALAALVMALPGAAAGQEPVGDRDDQFVVTGCVTPAGEFRGASQQSIFVWSRGDVYLSAPDIRFRPAERPVGTTGAFVPVFYWIDDENDFAPHVGQQVEIVGELSDELKRGEIEFDHEGALTEITFDAGGREARARIPTTWLGPQTRGRDVDIDVTVRTVDVEKVTVLGDCMNLGQ